MGMVEPVPAPEIFCSGLGEVEDIGGGCLRFYLYVMQRPVEGGVAERVIVAKVIAPSAAVPEAVLQMLRAMGRDISGKVIEIATRMN